MINASNWTVRMDLESDLCSTIHRSRYSHVPRRALISRLGRAHLMHSSQPMRQVQLLVGEILNGTLPAGTHAFDTYRIRQFSVLELVSLR
jgi:hypothetical protein